VRRSVYALCAALLLASGRGSAVADEAAEAAAKAKADADAKRKAEAESRRRLDLLKTKVAKWAGLRKEILIVCPTCRGSGLILTRRGAGVVREICTACDGRKRRASKTAVRALCYEYHTPEWRSRDTAKDEAEAQFKRWDRQEETPPLLRTYRLDAEKTALVDDAHALAWIYENDDTVSRASRWVWSVEPLTKQGGWYLYGGEVDGPWPDPAAAVSPPPPPPGPAEPPGPAPPPPPAATPLPLAERTALSDALEAAGVKHASVGAHVEGDAIVVRLWRSGLTAQDQLEEAIARDVVAAARSTLEARSKEARVRLVFEARMRDPLGAVELRPYRIVSIDREKFSKIRFENLSREEGLALFEQETPALDGLVLWWK
jgi:hypothetical protein